MNPIEAKQTLLRHAKGAPSETPDTLLTSLRPYSGIHEEHYLEILHALLVLAPELNRGDQVDRPTVHALWDLCRTARAWTRGPREPMFHGLQFIEPAEKKLLDERIDNIESIALALLRGLEVWSAFLGMPWYALKHRWGAKASFLADVFGEALQRLGEDETRMSIDDEVMLCDALGAMGQKAVRFASMLNEVRARTKFEEVRTAADNALERIAE